MAQHKAPTAVTVASTTDKSGIAPWVEKYWKIAALLAVCVIAVILFRAKAKHTERGETDANWSRLLASTGQDPTSGILRGTPQDLETLANGELKGDSTGGWALYIGATSAIEDRKLDEAESLLVQLKSSYPSHALLRQTFRQDSSSAPSTAVDRLMAHIEAERAFERDHPGLYENPAPASDAPRVKITTDRGAIVLGLYPDRAPKHVENFLKLVLDGYYVGTKFHAVFPDEYVQGGDPNTKDKDPVTWGQGGPDYALEKEAPKLSHFAGVISALPSPTEPAKMSGSLFLITTGDDHGLDRTHVPFGKVLEGMDVLEAIESAPMSASSFNRPETPVAIVSTEVL